MPAGVSLHSGGGFGASRARNPPPPSHQQADGSVVIPEALRPYMGGAEVIPAVAEVRETPPAE